MLYGGAAGGGKSYLMRAAAIFWCMQIPHLQCYLFRRLLPDLIKTHIEGPKGLRAQLHEYEKNKLVKIVEDEIRFEFNGSRIYLSHCHEEKDISKYLSLDIHLLLIDEGTTFTEEMYRFLRSRVRLAGLKIPDQYRHLFPRILIGSNPGSVGHEWVFRTFVQPVLGLEHEKRIWRAPSEEGGMLRQYLPAKLDDNPSLYEDDPDYEKRLSGLGSPALVKAYRDGDWTVVAGAFFPEFSITEHVIFPFTIPKYWTKGRSLDWGSYDPFSVLWGAISDGSVSIFQNGEHFRIPEGALVIYREWYGADDNNKGLRFPAELLTEGIIRRESPDEREDFVDSLTGKDTFDRRGSLSPGEIIGQKGVRFRPNKMRSRVPRWDRVRARFLGDERGPGLFIFNTCRNLIKTIPTLQHHKSKPEDAAPGNDHSCESLSHLCSIDYHVSFDPAKQKIVQGIEEYTYNQVLGDPTKPPRASGHTF